MERRYRETDSAWIREEFERYQNNRPCGACGGYRLRPEALAVKIADLHVGQVVQMSIREAYAWCENVPARLSQQKNEIARAILKEIRERLGFLNNVGLEYLTLSRNAGTLSGGESQRIRLASQIGSGLTGVLYVLDEPSIGLHQRDNDRLLTTLKNLRDQGNTVIVVEHDEEAIREADYVFDIGPGAGVHGGQIVAQGTPAEIAADPASITGQYLSGAREIAVPAERRKGRGKMLSVVKATGNNLKIRHRRLPAGQVRLRHRRLRRRQVHADHRDAVQDRLDEAQRRAADPRALRDDQGARTSRQGHRHRPAPHRAHAALEPRHLHGRLHPDPRLVRGPAGGQGARLQARAVFLQREGRPLRGVPGRRRHQDRDALPARCLRHLRDLQGQALQPRDAGGAVQGQVHRRRARHDGRGRAGLLQGGALDPREDGRADARGPRLHQGGPAGDDALGRRGAAREAVEGAGETLHRPHALHPRRTHHGPAFRGRAQAPRSAARAGGPGQHGRGDRAQSRRHQDRRLADRYRPRGRRWRRRDRGDRHARGRGRRSNAPIPGAISGRCSTPRNTPPNSSPTGRLHPGKKPPGGGRRPGGRAP
jgi:ABC-type multidrug transport system ATPase subunit